MSQPALPVLCKIDRSQRGGLVTQPTPGRLSPDFLEALHGIKSVRLYPKGTTLFKQGSAVAGVYVIESGEVRILLSTGDNQTQQLGVVGPGTMLALAEPINRGTHR